MEHKHAGGEMERLGIRPGTVSILYDRGFPNEISDTVLLCGNT